jgi:hypothetical protein
MFNAIPVVVFAYRRIKHLQSVLQCLQRDRVPEIIAYVDGPRGEQDRPAVEAVLALLRSVDWTRITVHAAGSNLGLGRSILAGVTAMAAQYDTFIVFEDDLICVPGTYAWMCAALERYRDDASVMSVTGWTHPRVRPADVVNTPYFDGRAECWVWGTWARAWQGMDETALQKIARCSSRGLQPDAYGADLPEMAAVELTSNIWAVRWLYHHLEHGGLCLRPPVSLVEHIGFDSSATNAGLNADGWDNPSLPAIVQVPADWPGPHEHPECAERWREAYPRRTSVRRMFSAIRRRLRLWS